MALPILPNLSSSQWGALDSSVGQPGGPGTLSSSGNYVPLPTGSPSITGTTTSSTGISGILSGISSALSGIGGALPVSTGSSSTGAGELTRNVSLTSDALILRIGFFLAGLVLLAGAVYTYKH